MSMNWVGCLNHNLTHDTSEKPSELPTTTSPPLQRAHIRLEMHPYDHFKEHISGWKCTLMTTGHS